eukprot:1158152-Pelagomonas_calceolata.AAC.2
MQVGIQPPRTFLEGACSEARSQNLPAPGPAHPPAAPPLPPHAAAVPARAAPSLSRVQREALPWGPGGPTASGAPSHPASPSSRLHHRCPLHGYHPRAAAPPWSLPHWPLSRCARQC